jgi:alpha-glucosidase
MLLTLRGTPFIYYGEEIGMNELRLPRRLLKDPVGKKWYPFHRGRDGCRSPMQWDESPGAGFTTGEPWLPVGPEAAQRNVAAQEEDPASLLNFYRKLIWLRKEQPALLGGSYRSVVEGVPGDCYLYLRETEEQRLLVALNFSASRRDINLPPRLQPARLLISTDPHRAAGELDRMPQLGPYEGCLIHLNS